MILHRLVSIGLGVCSLCACSSGIDIVLESPLDRPLWRAERAGVVVNAVADSAVNSVTFSVKGLPKGFADISLLKCVKGDGFAEGYRQCGAHEGDGRDSIYVYDRITSEIRTDFSPGDTIKLWLSVKIPSDARPGLYKGTIAAKGPLFRKSVPFEIRVCDRVLPKPHDWSFHLDLWQNPFAVARYYDVTPWSEEHFNKMAPLMKRLAEAGQKVVTATIIDRPWNGQTWDPYSSMIVKYHSPDGKWSYDYSAFDKWVEFMFSLGIDSQINCYSMIPWRMSFDYVDLESGGTHHLEASAGSREYYDYWFHFLKDFASHLRAKGWFERTMIAMDERPEDTMVQAMKIIKTAVPGMKISLTGDYHPTIDDAIDDMCITFSRHFPEKILKGRHIEGKTSTYYVCCAERYPNTFLASDPMEATWLGWYAAAHGLDGLLRWAYNSWTEDPDNDARFRTWPAGDCYIVYPQGSSVRFERLVEGIQDYEKIRILKEEWSDQPDRLSALEEALSSFTLQELEKSGAFSAISDARKAIDSYLN